MVSAKITLKEDIMSHYKHFALEEREIILKYLTMGYSLIQITEILCRNISTISRELN